MPKPIGKAEYMRRAIADARHSRIFVLKNRGLEFDTFDVLPSGTKEIHIINTSIHQLPSLPSSLTKLILTNTIVEELPPLPASLTHLRCLQNRYLTKLPTLPSGLQELVIVESPLEELPLVPESVKTLHIVLLPNPRRPREYDDVAEIVRKAQDETHALEKENRDTWNASRSVQAIGRTLPDELESRVGEYLGLPRSISGDKQRDQFKKNITRRRQELKSRPLGAPGVGGGKRRRKTRKRKFL